MSSMWITPSLTSADPGLTHALEEVDAAALALAETPEQVVAVLGYVTAA